MTDAAPETVQPAYRVLQVGDPVPWFKQNSTSNPHYSFDTAAGRYVVLCFYGTRLCQNAVGGRITRSVWGIR
jgi:hypothetical protein